MGKIFFSSDLHFGHSNVLFKYDKRPFSSLEEQDEEIINRWNKKVSKDDTVYVLGDISFYDDEKTYEILKRLNGKMKHSIFMELSRKVMNFSKSAIFL